MKPSDVVILIPTYNEKENLPQLVPMVFQHAPEVNILVIDDNSPDGTGDLADEMARNEPRLSVLHRTAKEGLGAAYLHGMAVALERGAQAVITMDADFSHDPKYLPTFLDLLQTHDVVVGSRRVKGGGVENWGVLRHLISGGGSLYCRLLLSPKIHDFTGGYNGYTKDALERIDLSRVQTKGFGFQVEMKYRALRAACRVVETPIHFVDRALGKSKMSGKIFVEALLKAVRLRFEV